MNTELLVLYETHTTHRHLLIMLIYTLQHLVNVLLKCLQCSVLRQPTTLFFFLLRLSTAIRAQWQTCIHSLRMFYVHIVARKCGIRPPFLYLPGLRCSAFIVQDRICSLNKKFTNFRDTTSVQPHKPISERRFSMA